MEKKLDYEAPSAQIFSMYVEGVVCGSYQMNFGDTNQAGSISNDDVFDGGTF